MTRYQWSQTTRPNAVEVSDVAPPLWHQSICIGFRPHGVVGVQLPDLRLLDVLWSIPSEGWLLRTLAWGSFVCRPTAST